MGRLHGALLLQIKCGGCFKVKHLRVDLRAESVSFSRNTLFIGKKKKSLESKLWLLSLGYSRYFIQNESDERVTSRKTNNSIDC